MPCVWELGSKESQHYGFMGAPVILGGVYVGTCFLSCKCSFLLAEVY